MTVNPLAKTAEPTGFRKFIRADKTQRVLLIVSFMFVPLVLLLMFTYIPFGKMVQFSFYNRNYLSEGTWVGLANYIEVFKRKDIFGSLIVSVYYMGGAVVQLVLALFFASLMVFKVKGEGIYKACMFFPYLICGIAVGFIFKFFYARGFVWIPSCSSSAWSWRTSPTGCRTSGSTTSPWRPPRCGATWARTWSCSWAP